MEAPQAVNDQPGHYTESKSTGAPVQNRKRDFRTASHEMHTL